MATSEIGALGAALAVGIGAGVFQDCATAFKEAVKICATFQLNPTASAAYRHRYSEWLGLIELMKHHWEK